MLDDRDIARWRLRRQHLVEPHALTAPDVVGSLLAVQAENLSQSLWALAARTQRPAETDLAGLLGTEVVRTHVLRPTWHYVRADDIGWLLDLTAPRVLRTTSQQLTTVHGLDERGIERAYAQVADVLAGGRELTRTQLADELGGAELVGNRLMILLGHAELLGLICSGRPAYGEHTYA